MVKIYGYSRYLKTCTMSQLSRIMSSIAPKKTKKPKRKKKPTPKFVKLPRIPPHNMSHMQWKALVAQRQQWDEYRRELCTEKHDARLAHMVRSVVKIQRWWWMWRFRKWLPKRRKYREWVRTNNILPMLIEFEFPFRNDPLLLGNQLVDTNIDNL